MVLDIVFLAMMLIAVISGMKNGLIVAIFSIIAWILGLMAAFQFSDVAASYLQNTLHISPRFLSIISFVCL